MKHVLTGAIAGAALMATSALADTDLRTPKMSAKRVAHAAGEQSSGLGAAETFAVLAGIAVLGMILRSSSGGAGSVMTDAMVSDARLKTDIAATGRSVDGIQIYSYRYRGLSTVYEGVMAQDVALHRPDALVPHASGFLAVDYGKLGVPLRIVD